MKALLWLVAVVIIVALGWYLLASPSSNSAQPPSGNATTTQLADIIPGVSNVTYTNAQFGFSLEYPSSASTTEEFSSGYLPLTQTPVAAITLPSSMFTGTNLGEAGVYIGATSSPSVVAGCMQASQQEQETAVANETIGGQQFSIFTSTGVGAGNIYQEKTYRTVENGSCLEIVELLHSGNIANYTPGAVQQFNQDEFSGILDAIVQTYQPQ